MDIMEILNVVLSGMIVVMIALLSIMLIISIMGKIMSFARTYKSVSEAKNAAEKSV